MIVLCPTRNRPERAAEMIQSFRETVMLVRSRLILVVDNDDPCLGFYRNLPTRFRQTRYADPPTVMVLAPQDTGNLTRATNSAWARVCDEDIIGHVGDDHLFRTEGWDRAIEAALARPGIAYVDDLLQRENKVGTPFMSGEIARALGWYALPAVDHLYIDDAWTEIGRATGCLRYLPEVVIEHMHAGVGKAPWDDGYRAVDHGHNRAWVEDQYARYCAWRETDFDSACERVRAVL